MSSDVSSSKVGVLIHGCHVNATGWKEIVFGNQEGHLGRVPMGVREALEHQAQLIYWGTGASEKKGKKESRYTYDKAQGSKLKDLAIRVERTPVNLSGYLSRVSVIDEEAQNTAQEIRNAIRKCQELNIHELILVSSPTHIARCHQTALQIKRDEFSELSLKICALASQVGFFQRTPEGTEIEHPPSSVAIFEPSHRGDMPPNSISDVLKGIFRHLGNSDARYYQKLCFKS